MAIRKRNGVALATAASRNGDVFIEKASRQTKKEEQPMNAGWRSTTSERITPRQVEEVVLAEPDWSTRPYGQDQVARVVRTVRTAKGVREIVRYFGVGKNGIPSVEWAGEITLAPAAKVKRDGKMVTQKGRAIIASSVEPVVIRTVVSSTRGEIKIYGKDDPARRIVRMKLSTAPSWRWDGRPDVKEWIEVYNTRGYEVELKDEAKRPLGLFASRGGEFRYPARELNELNSDGDNGATMISLIHQGLLSKAHSRQIEQNDWIQGYGEDWVSDEVSIRQDTERLAMSYTESVLASKWGVSGSEAIKLRDAMLDCEFSQMVFGLDSLKIVKGWLEQRTVDQTIAYLQELNTPTYTLEVAATRWDDEDRAGIMLQAQEAFEARCEVHRDKKYDHLADRDREERRLANMHKEWKTYANDGGVSLDLSEEEFKADGPSYVSMLEELMVEVDGKDYPAAKLLARIRRCERVADLSALSAKMMASKMKGYVGCDWVWENYNSHWLNLSARESKTKAMVINALRRDELHVARWWVQDRMVGLNKVRQLMVQQGRLKPTARYVSPTKRLKDFIVKELKLTRFDEVVVLPPSTEGLHKVYDTHGACIEALRSLNRGRLIKVASLGVDEYDYGTYYVPATMRPDGPYDLFIVKHKTKDGDWVLYKTVQHDLPGFIPISFSPPSGGEGKVDFLGDTVVTSTPRRATQAETAIAAAYAREVSVDEANNLPTADEFDAYLQMQDETVDVDAMTWAEEGDE